MFYTITGEFVNKKKIIETFFTDEEKVNMVTTTTSGVEKLAIVKITPLNKIKFGQKNLDYQFKDDLAFTVKSKNGVKYLIAEKILASNGTVVNVSDLTIFNTIPSANLMLVFCFSPKRFANDMVENIWGIDLAYEDSDSITSADRTLLSNAFIPSIDELIEDELIVNNVTTDYYASKKNDIITQIENAVNQIPQLSESTKNERISTGVEFLDKLENGTINSKFMSDSGEEGEYYYVLDDTSDDTGDDTGDDTTADAPLCPPGYKCIPTDSWNILINDVNNLETNLDNMTILDGDASM